MTEKAVDAFAAHIEGARIELAKIQQVLKDHFGVDPDSVHWGNVGDAQLLRFELTRIADRLLRRGEHAV